MTRKRSENLFADGVRAVFTPLSICRIPGDRVSVTAISSANANSIALVVRQLSRNLATPIA